VTPGVQSDFLALFQPGAPWPTAASKVQVFKVSTQFVMQSPDADVITMIRGLHDRGIALAVEGGFLYGAGGCGRGMEGFAAQHIAAALATRIKKLGGEIAYVAMDEPLWFGGLHVNHVGACHWQIPQIVAQVAEGVAELRRIFPQARVGDIEPIGHADFDWPGEIAAWSAAYRAAVGVPLAFIHADVAWTQAWQAPLKAVAASAHAEGIPFGVIIDSDRPDTVDAAWTDHATNNLRAVRTVLGGTPDHLIFQSWTAAPSRFLPDTQAGTLTNLVARTPTR
jgi:hypothetical protein